MPLAALEPVRTAMNRRVGRGVLVFLAIGLALAILGGCSTPTLAGRWKQADIVADGKAVEWPGDPLFADDDPDLTVDLRNDHQSLSLCIQTQSETLQRQFLSDGLTVWLDPRGGKDTVFGIHVHGGSFQPSDGRHAHATGGPPPSSSNRRPDENRPPFPWLAPIDQVSITYADATGPLTMAMDEVRRTGIEIGRGRGDARTVVYEFNIAFNAAPSLEILAPGKVLGVGIFSGGADPGKRQPAGNHGDMQQSGPPGGRMGGGRMGGGHGGPPGGHNQGRAVVWVEVQLADGGKTSDE